MRKIFRVAALTEFLSACPPLNEPFGLATLPAPVGDLTNLCQWSDPAIRADEATIAVCRTDSACGSPTGLRLAGIVEEAMQ